MSSSRGVIWNRPERAARGPAPSLSREQITTAAVALADTQGIDAVSMRALALDLGVGAASLYRRNELERLTRDVRSGPFHPPNADATRDLIGQIHLGIA